MAEYKNPWHDPTRSYYGPKFYTTEVKPIKYRGFMIYHRLSQVWDVVKDGVCIGQTAGLNGAIRRVDLILDSPSDYFSQRALSYLKEV